MAKLLSILVMIVEPGTVKEENIESVGIFIY